MLQSKTQAIQFHGLINYHELICTKNSVNSESILFSIKYISDFILFKSLYMVSARQGPS